MKNMLIRSRLSPTRNSNSITLELNNKTMAKKTALSFAFILVSATIFLSGCKKFVHENIQAASNSTVALRTMNDVFEQLNTAVDSSLETKIQATWMMNGTLCTNVSLNAVGAGFPKTLTIDYGAGCIGTDGIERSGMITAVFDGELSDENTTINVWFTDYVNGQYAVTGKDSITNIGADGEGYPTFTETIEDVTLAWGNQTIKWNAELTRTWLEGDTTNFTTDTVGGTLGTAGLADDVFGITGTASGNDSNTHPFTLEVTSSLTLPSSCKYITEGMFMVSPTNFNDGTVDYGMGECDQQATLEVDGEVYNFTQ